MGDLPSVEILTSTLDSLLKNKLGFVRFLDSLGEFLKFCWTSAQMVIVSAPCVIAIDFQAWKTGDCMYSEVTCINLLLNNWVKLGAIKSAKGSIQCLVNERIHKGWIICIQTYYELILKTKIMIILHTIFSPCSRGRLMEGFLTGLFCGVCCCCAATDPCYQHELKREGHLCSTHQICSG